MAYLDQRVRDLGKKVDELLLCPRCVEYMHKAGIRKTQLAFAVLGDRNYANPSSYGQMWSRMQTGQARLTHDDAVRLLTDVLGIQGELEPKCLYLEWDDFLREVDEAGLRAKPTMFGAFYDLWRRAQPWDRIRFVTPAQRGGFAGDDDDLDVPVLSVGQMAAIEIQPVRPGHLILIQCGPKAINCLVPSPMQPKTAIGVDRVRFPANGSIAIGRQGAPFLSYWLLAAITTESPRLPTWAQFSSSGEARIPPLSQKQQTELVRLIDHCQDLTLYQKHYAVLQPTAVP